MDRQEGGRTEARFRAYAADLAAVLGHADRVRPFEDYCIGLLSAEGRESVEPLAAVTAPERTAAQHQSLLHLVAQAPWSDQAVLRRVRERVLPSITREEPIQAWIVDDTSYPKKGKHSVGGGTAVLRRAGKQDNCQVAVSLSVATHQAACRSPTGCICRRSGPMTPARRGQGRRTGDDEVPDQAGDRDAADARDAGRRRDARAVLADPPMAMTASSARGITELGLPYALACSPACWSGGPARRPSQQGAGRSRGASGQTAPRPVQVKTLAKELAADAWQTIAWREGSNTAAHLALCPTAGAARRTQRQKRSEARGRTVAADRVAGRAKPNRTTTGSPPCRPISRSSGWSIWPSSRWRIERDYLELKQEVGLGHYEGRGWRGFHHHARLCIAAYGFLVSETGDFPPSGPARAWRRTRSAVPPVIDPEVLPLRSQRHMPNSITTLRIRLARILVRALPRCPCCGQTRQRREVRNE